MSTVDPCPASGPVGRATPTDAEADPAAVRAAMVGRLVEGGSLRLGSVRDALRSLPREVLMPQACVRRSGPDEEGLADSAFNGVTERLFRVTRTWVPHEVLGNLRTTSFAAPDLFAERLHGVEDEGLALVHAHPHAGEGSLVAEAMFKVLLGRRPEGAR